MRCIYLSVAALFVISSGGLSQEISVYSEFVRIDPSGHPVRADRGTSPPREILSPAIARNAFASFHVVVEGMNGQPFTIQMAQNPEDAVQVTAYRERYSRVGHEWIPDGLEPVPLPYSGRLDAVPGQTAQAFWVDLFADREAPVRRIKVEPQVYIDDGWILYPMEVRVSAAALGAGALWRSEGVDDASLPAAASAVAVWRHSACGSRENKPAGQPLSIRSLIARNAVQDVRLAGGVPPPPLLRLAGVTDRKAFCRAAHGTRGVTEAYLTVRDALVGARE